VGSGPADRRDDGAAARVTDSVTGGVAARVTAGDRVAAATAELYGADPEAFTGRRGELAAAARDAGDRAAAKAITGLRRPTRAAWVVNQLARADPAAPRKLAELAAALRAAQEAGHGPRLRELSAARGSLVDALAAQALAAAGVAEPPPSLRLEVSQTLTAAIADPEVAADFAAGRLTRAVQWSGFGVLPADAGPGREAGPHRAARPDTDAGEPPGAATTRDWGSAAGVTTRAGKAGTRGRPSRGATKADEESAAGGTTRPGRAGSRERPARDQQAARETPSARSASAPDAGRRQAELNDRLVREAAERAARRREQYADAERLLALAAAAATEAVTAEDRLEAEVRDLEQRLTQARADLATTRVRARHAEAAERRARQALGRLAGD
jgi:hypothetical protein